jgi:hypothetical protein
MSEADSQNTHFASVQTTDSAASPPGDWQTIDFPGAISVDAIPHDRHQDDRAAPPITHAELAAAQARVSQLFHELELSHQAAQRQQILVETLNEQLSISQERIAQLERDCALTQQRHNEQVQQRLQAENLCRDLRMRLHRQQQQTLQFKVALEKCLEMPTPANPTASAMPSAMPIDLDPSLMSAMATENAHPQTLVIQSQPVKPWSASVQPAHAGFGFSTSKAVDSEQFGSAKMGLNPAIDRSETESLSNPLTISQDSFADHALGQTDASSATPFSETEDLWSEAVLLNDSTQEQGAIAVASDTLFQAIAELDLNALLPDDFNTAPNLEPNIAPSQIKVETLPLESPATMTKATAIAPQQSEEPTLPQSFLVNLKSEETVNTSKALTANSFPSPIVYPLRPSKKLTSLAAVELPTFPRLE